MSGLPAKITVPGSKGPASVSPARFPFFHTGVFTAAALFVISGAQATELHSATVKPDQAVQIAQAAPFPSFSALVERVAPAVVSLRVKANPTAATAHEEEAEEQGPGKANPFGNTPPQRFFGPRGPFPPPHWSDDREKEQGPSTPVQGQGSGFFITPDGYIVTNNHLVEGAIKVQVVMESGDIIEAKIIGTDPGTDLALLKVDAGHEFPYVALGRAEAKVGDWVIALGNPFGLEGTVTAGIVSARGRDIGMGPYDNFIQIDAPVNRGNSGGPTFNQAGEVIGVNTAIFSPSGGSVGIAFAIPAKTVEHVVAQLREKGHVARGWLGVQVQPVTPELADSLGLKQAKGALVSLPVPGGPAYEGGIRPSDVILKVNGDEVKDSRDLARKIALVGPDATVKLALYRDGKYRNTSVKLTLEDSAGGQGAGRGALPQAEIRTLGLKVAPAMDGPGGPAGLAVVEIKPDGKAADVGLFQGDIILSANGANLSNPGALEAALRSAKAAGKKHALALVQRGGTQVYVALPADQG